MNARQEEIKALLEGHSTHREQHTRECMQGFPSVSKEELEELRPIAKQISDRFHFAVTGALGHKS